MKKRMIAAISAAAMLITAVPIVQAAKKDAAVTITGAAVVRSTTSDFLTNFTNTTALKSAADQLQIFSNRSDVSNGSQCGAYYQYEIPEYEGENEAVTLTLENAYTSTNTLHVISVGTENAGNVGSDTYTAANVFKDVSAAYTAAGKTVIDVASPVSNKYTVDITAFSKQGTNAVFVYTDDNTNDKTPRHDVKNASISMTYDTLPTVVWRASDSSWSLSSGDRINGYANVSNGELTTTMVADNETSNYSGDVKTAFDSSTYHGVAPAVNANCNIMGMIATAGSASEYPFRAGTKYTLHYTLSGSWTNAVANTPNGAYLNLSTWTNVSARKENLTNLNVTSTSAGVPLNKTYDFTPSVDCYAQFNFELRRVKAGDTMTVSNIYVTTDVEEHTVTFDSNGGSAVAAQKVLANETATEPAAPTREGCSFDGWLLNGAAYDFSTPVTGDITLTASWKSNTGDTLSEEKIDLTGSAVKLYRFPLTGGKYKYAEDVTSNSTYKALVDGKYTDASIPANNYVMIDLGKEYNISTLKAYQNDITTAGTGGNFVAVLPGCTGTSSEFAKADLNDLIRTNASYNTLTTEHGTNCFTYSQLTSDKHNMGSYRYIILHNGGNYVLNLAEVEIYEDKTEKNAYLSVRNFYNDHMVLQRGKSHVIKGYSATGTSVSVTMTNGTNTQTAAATPDSEGNWTASVPAMPAGLTPYTITITDDKGGSVTLSDVLVGDVFLASGQSNMAYEAPRTATQNITQYSNTGGPAGSVYYKKGLYELQKPLANENIRFIKMRDDTAVESGLVTADVPIWIDWMKSSDIVAETSSAGVATGNTSEGILQMSTLAAFFADARVKAEPGIPVGVIQASRGGSAINIWSEGGRLYNNHLAPLDGLNIAGILWYQGCANSNATGFTTYHNDFEKLIKTYRGIFNDNTLPFMYVQLAPYKNNKPEYENAGSQRFQVMREIQREMLDDSDINTNLYMAVSMDTTEDSHHNNSGNIVNAHLIHPLGKDTLGRRMAAAYAKMKDGTNAVVDGPLVSGASANGGTVTVSFKEGTADGLKVLNPDYTYQHKGQVGWRSDTTELEEFKLAGADGVYYNATAKIVGDKVQVTSAYVTEPKYVSYAYSELPKNPNLGNGADLPASPFNISVDGSAAPVAPALTAETDKTMYEVTMDSNGGSNVEPQTVVSGEQAKEPKAPKKDGYVFGGWYTDSACTIAYDFNAPVTEAMMLYAKWTPVEPVVFSVEKESFTAHGDAAVHAYSFTAVIADNVKVKLGAASGEKEKYIDTDFTGGTVCFGAIAPTDDVKAIYK